MKQKEAYAFIHQGYWEDIGTIESYYKANIALTQKNSPLDLYDSKHPVFAQRNHLPPPKIHQTTLSNAIICEGSVIVSASIKNSILGPRTIIGENAIIENSYLLGNDHYRPHTSKIACK